MNTAKSISLLIFVCLNPNGKYVMIGGSTQFILQLTCSLEIPLFEEEPPRLFSIQIITFPLA